MEQVAINQMETEQHTHTQTNHYNCRQNIQSNEKKCLFVESTQAKRLNSKPEHI